MSYYSDLTQSLRKRGCEEAQVLEVLEDVCETVEAKGKAPENELGTPDDCASGCGPRKRPPGSTTLNCFGGLGLISVVIYAVWPQLFGFTNPVLEQFAGMIAMLVLLILGAFAAAFVDTRLPKSTPVCPRGSPTEVMSPGLMIRRSVYEDHLLRSER